jgi:hypothetical protein
MQRRPVQFRLNTLLLLPVYVAVFLAFVRLGGYYAGVNFFGLLGLGLLVFGISRSRQAYVVAGLICLVLYLIGGAITVAPPAPG